MTKKFRRVCGVAAVVALALGLTACGGANNKTSSQSESKSGIVKTDGAPSSPTGTLKIGVFQETPSLDPPRTTQQNNTIMDAVYDTLTACDAKGNVSPWLATKWSQPDPSTWEFKLRDDVTFHDGSKFDAETVKLNLERDKTIEGGPWGYIYDTIKAVTVVDPTTVQVQFTSPQPSFPLQMCQVAGGMVSPQAIKAGTDLTRTEAGSGGWIWNAAEHQEGTKHILDANPNYWNKDAVLVKTIEVDIIADTSARMNAAQAGQIDVMGTVDGNMFNAAKDAGLTIQSSIAFNVTLAIFDRKGTIVPAFASQEVRQAMQLLVDVNGYNKAVFGGNGDATLSLGAKGTYWYDDSLTKKYALNVKKAKQMLAEAGYKDGFSFEVPSVPLIKQRLEGIQQMLATGGITMNIVDSPDGQYTADLRKGLYPAGHLVPNAIDPFNMWYRSISNQSPYNPFKLTDTADLDAKMQQAAAMSSDKERAPLLKEVQQQIFERGLIITAGQSPSAAAFGPRVHATQEPLFANSSGSPRPHYMWVS